MRHLLEIRPKRAKFFLYRHLVDYWHTANEGMEELSIIWKLDLTNKMKRSFFQAAVVSILLYGCTTWTLTKRLEKKLDGNYPRMLWANWTSPGGNTPQGTNYTATCHHENYPSQTNQTCRTLLEKQRRAHKDLLLWTPTYGQVKAERPARTYIQQLCEDTGCSPEDLPEAMNDREKWWERVRDIRASGTTWWYIYFLNCLMIFVLQNTPWNPGLQTILHELNMYIPNIYDITGTLAQRLGCSPMARETWVQSQVESYQRL